MVTTLSSPVFRLPALNARLPMFTGYTVRTPVGATNLTVCERCTDPMRGWFHGPLSYWFHDFNGVYNRFVNRLLMRIITQLNKHFLVL